MNHIPLPLPESVFYELDTLNQSDYSIDVDKIDFGNEDKIESTIIYMRNLQLNMKLDFSNVSFEEKEQWILKFINFDFKDSSIKTLQETVVTILANESLGLDCIFSAEEVALFRKNNEDLIKEITRFLVSLNLISIVLRESQGNDTVAYKQEDFEDVEIIKEKPSYFTTIVDIIDKYPMECDGIRLFFNESIKPVLYTHCIDCINKNFNFYSIILKLPSISIMNYV